MKTEILKIDSKNIDIALLSRAGNIIADGGLVAFPTETVYGLGANALDGPACDRIFEAKGRPHDNPLIVHVLTPSDCQNYADTDSSPLFQKLSERYMPGPLTIILPKRSIIPDSVTVGLDTVALRCPKHPIARELIRLSGVPIAAPSANLSGKPSPTNAQHVVSDMNGRVDMIIDGGSCDVGLESTVISLKNDCIHLLRPGFVTLSDLKSVTENVIVSDAVLSALSTNEKPESPGMKYRHYAPKADLTMVDGEEEKVISFFQAKISEGCGILCFDEDLQKFKDSKDLAVSFGSRGDLLSQANKLFDALRSFDGKNVPHIYARFTSREDLGLAISNRLLRACAFDLIKL